MIHFTSSQQLSGMVAIFYYSVTFFKSAGIEGPEAQLANLGVGAIMVGKASEYAGV